MFVKKRLIKLLKKGFGLNPKDNLNKFESKTITEFVFIMEKISQREPQLNGINDVGFLCKIGKLSNITPLCFECIYKIISNFDQTLNNLEILDVLFSLNILILSKNLSIIQNKIKNLHIIHI